MSVLDWVVFVAFLAWVLADGVRRGRKAQDLSDYYAGSRSIPWWAAGLSIMATQASAITVIGTTGKGHESGMEFLQTYIGLPVAMVLLCIFIVPLLRARPILTAYEFLEHRFGPVTRTIASIVFLVSRCAALGIVIYAPAIVLATTTGLSEKTTILILGVLTTAYTMVGGVSAVVWTDVKQMVVILVGLGITGAVVLARLLDEFSLGQVFDLVGSVGKLDALEVAPVSMDLVPAWRPDEGGEAPAPSFWSDKYSLWSGLLGGTFLMLAYFGCDQSQAQRLLTSPDANDSRKALLVSGFAKLPMQIGVLLLGVLLWLFHAAFGAPLWFSETHWERVDAGERAALEQRYDEVQRERRDAMRRYAVSRTEADREVWRETTRAARALRSEAWSVVPPDVHGTRAPADTNYVFPHFVLHELPVVLVGLLFAAIFAAAMSSVDSVLNSLSAASVVDLYRRWVRPDASEARCLRVGRVMTVVWGGFATLAALYLTTGGGSIIEQVNRIGSFFYGTLLGGFVLALVSRRAGDAAAACGLLAGMASVFWVYLYLEVEFLWFNLIGAVAVVVVGTLAARVLPARRSA